MIDETFTPYSSTYGTGNATDPVSNMRPLLGPGSESYRRLSGGGVLRRTICQSCPRKRRHLHIWLTRLAHRSEGLRGRCRAPSSGDSARQERAM